MEIRVGKYRTRDGHVAVVTHRLDDADAEWPFRGHVEDSGESWRPDGSWEEADVECGLDLVERIEDVVEPGRFEITGPGEYRTREGKRAVVNAIREFGQWPVRGRIADDGTVNAVSTWRLNGEWEVEPGMECKHDIIGPWIEPVSALTEATNVVREAEGLPPLPTDADVVDAEFVEPDFVEVSAASLRQPGPTIRDVIEHERAETAAFASATEEANRHAFAALRSLTRALNRHGIAPGSEVADAHAFALLVIDGFDS